jgi:hypothetical protein
MIKKIIFITIILLIGVVFYLTTKEVGCLTINKNSCSDIELSEIEHLANNFTYKTENGKILNISNKNILDLESRVLYNIENSFQSTGDPVIDSILIDIKSKKRYNKKIENIFEFIYVTENAKKIKLLEERIEEIASIFKIDNINKKIKIFITDKNDKKHSLLNKKLLEYGCTYQDYLINVREPNKNYGAMVNYGLCRDEYIIILDLWQYKDSKTDSPATIIQTILDEFFTIMQFNNFLNDEYNSNRWFYEGSQQVPLYYYSLIDNVRFNDYNIMECSDIKINDFEREDFISGKEISCEHFIGLLAAKLIIANVGVERYLNFFEDNKTRYEDKFNKYFNINYNDFKEKVGIYHDFIKSDSKLIKKDDYNKLVVKLRF